MDNYTKSRDRAQRYFLGFDQEALVRRWPLRRDARYLFVDFLGQPYRICRSSGQVCRLPEEVPAGHDEVLSIFDLLCHEGHPKEISGRLAPVNSLKGNAAVGVGTDFYGKFAAAIDRRPEAFRQACLACGGQSVDMGDMGYRFAVFADLPVVLKFYRSDEDFPASLTLLWEENMLQFVFYETVFYIAGALLRRLEAEMERR